MRYGRLLGWDVGSQTLSYDYFSHEYHFCCAGGLKPGQARRRYRLVERGITSRECRVASS